MLPYDPECIGNWTHLSLIGRHGNRPRASGEYPYERGVSISGYRAPVWVPGRPLSGVCKGQCADHNPLCFEQFADGPQAAAGECVSQYWLSHLNNSQNST